MGHNLVLAICLWWHYITLGQNLANSWCSNGVLCLQTSDPTNLEVCQAGCLGKSHYCTCHGQTPAKCIKVFINGNRFILCPHDWN